MKNYLLSLSLFLASPLLLFSQQKEKESYKNSIGMEFVLVQTGTMTVGKIEIECPTFPDTRDVPDSEIPGLPRRKTVVSLEIMGGTRLGWFDKVLMN